MENLDPQKQELVDKAKALPKKAGRPSKDFGPVVKAAAVVLHDAGLTMSDIARELNISPATAAKMIRAKDERVTQENLSDVRKRFSTDIAEIVAKMLTAANSDEYVKQLAKSRNPGLIEALSKLIEKLNLLEGKSTSIMEIRDTAKLVEDKMQELEDFEAALRNSIVIPENPKDN